MDHFLIILVFLGGKSKPYHKNKYKKAGFKGGGYLPTFSGLSESETALLQGGWSRSLLYPMLGVRGLALLEGSKNQLHAGPDPGEK